MNWYMVSTIAMEREAKVRSFARERQLLTDILPDEYERGLIHAGGHRQFPQVGTLVSVLREGLGAIANKLNQRREVVLDAPLPDQERGIAPV